MKPTINALVARKPDDMYTQQDVNKNPAIAWDAIAWDGHVAFITPAAWHRWFSFIGVTMTINLFSDDWSLDRETARTIAIEISQGKRTYYSSALNEDNSQWRKTW